jgi:hypothetical protein
VQIWSAVQAFNLGSHLKIGHKPSVQNPCQKVGDVLGDKYFLVVRCRGAFADGGLLANPSAVPVWRDGDGFLVGLPPPEN